MWYISASIFGAYPHLKLDSHNEFHGKIRNNEHISVLVKLKCVCVPGSFNGFVKYSTCHVKLVYRNLIRIYSRHFKKGILNEVGWNDKHFSCTYLCEYMSRCKQSKKSHQHGMFTFAGKTVWHLHTAHDSAKFEMLLFTYFMSIPSI